MRDTLPIERVVCGIDPSELSREAARQAAAIASADARIWGAAVWDPGLAMHAGIHAGVVADDLRHEAVASLHRAEGAVPGLQPILINGAVVAGILSAIAEADADLVSVGAHGTSRFGLLGSTAWSMARHAPCSTLIARPGNRDGFPRTILHAADGSPESMDAAHLAGSIAARTGAAVVCLNVGSDLERAQALAAESVALLEESGHEAVPEARDGNPSRRIAEVAGSIGADLITIGSRGRTGLRALGSVSERVARQAPCSVLIVRRPAHPAVEDPSASTTHADSPPRTEAGTTDVA